jgi:uncharacterized C2H2 Zn-finger protein
MSVISSHDGHDFFKCLVFVDVEALDNWTDTIPFGSRGISKSRSCGDSFRFQKRGIRHVEMKIRCFARVRPCGNP